MPPCWKNKVCEVAVRSCTCFLVVLITRICSIRWRCVRLLECSPAPRLAPRNYCEEKRKKFLTCRINNKLCQILKSRWEHIFSFGWMKNSFSRGKMSSFERNSILSHLPGTLKVFWRLAYPFLFNSFRAAAPNLHVTPKTEIYLDFSIKNAGLVFVIEICDFSVFAYNFYSFS